MSLRLYLTLFKVVLILSSSYFIKCATASQYKIKLISLEKCKVAENKEYQNAPLTYSLSARKINRNTTLITTKFNVFSREGPVFLSIRGYQVRQGASKDLIFNLEKVRCTNPITVSLVRVINLKLDKDCYAVPGNYSADKINIEEFSPILTKAMIGPGKYSYDMEASTDKGVAVCIALTCDISNVK